MSVADVRYAIGDPKAALVPAPPDPNAFHCTSLDSRVLPPSISLMFQRDQLVRINVHAIGPHTEAGVGVGDTEDRIRQKYEGRIEVTLHPYLDEGVGHYLIVRGRESADHDYGMIFETKNGLATSFRAGRLQAVNFISGCG
jgi:hypothetical protein